MHYKIAFLHALYRCGIHYTYMFTVTACNALCSRISLYYRHHRKLVASAPMQLWLLLFVVTINLCRQSERASFYLLYTDILILIAASDFMQRWQSVGVSQGIIDAEVVLPNLLWLPFKIVVNPFFMIFH